MKRFFKWLLIGWAAFWLLILLLVVIAAIAHNPVPDGSVLRVTLDGELPEMEGVSFAHLFEEHPPVTTRALTSAVRAAGEDPRISGLVLDIKDPGLSLAQVQELDAAMEEFKKSGKWSAAYLETAGEFSPGNGAYAIAVTAGEVVLAPSGDINLAALRAEVPFLRGLLDKLEIEPHFERRKQFKTAPDLFTEKELTEAHKESLVSMVDDLQSSLVTHIATRREHPEDEVRAWIQRGTFAANEAKEKGLIDTIGYWDSILDASRGRAERDDPFVEVEVYAQNLPKEHPVADFAYIVVAGAIMRGESEPGLGDSTEAGSDTITQAFRDAHEDGVRGVLLRVDSPGGSYIGSDLIRREVELVRKAGIPVVVSMGSLAASGGYFVSMDADRIVADPATLTGSIGVYAGTFSTRRFFGDLLGVTFGVYETMPGAPNFSLLDPPNESERARRTASLDRIYDDFVTKAAAGRKKSVEEIDAVAKGRVWTGRQAKERGLVDELGGFLVAVRELKELTGIDKDATVSLTPYPAPETAWSALKKTLGSETRARAALTRVHSFVQGALSSRQRVLSLPPALSPSLDGP